MREGGTEYLSPFKTSAGGHFVLDVFLKADQTLFENAVEEFDHFQGENRPKDHHQKILNRALSFGPIARLLQ